MTAFETALGNYELERYPKAHDATLLAWDQADRLLLSFVQTFNEQNTDHQSNNKKKSIWVINDEFGALTIPLLNQFQVTCWNDSYLAHSAIQKNVERNQLDSTPLYLPSTAFQNSNKPSNGTRSSLTADNAPFLIIIKPPKNLRLLHYQLETLATHFSHTPIAIGLMQKFSTPKLKQLVESSFANKVIHRAEKKARIISGECVNPSPYGPPIQTYAFDGITIANFPNVFSSDSLDIGARFFLQNFPEVSQVKRLADLGCGNGVLSAFAATQNPNLVITGFDESYMAVASAQETFRQNHLNNGEFLVSNCLSAAKDRCFDMIVCNPPFHQQRRVTTDTALKMFREAHQKLVTGGTLWIVANRHLGYHTSLKRRFGQCQTVAANNKFVILSSTKESITNE